MRIFLFIFIFSSLISALTLSTRETSPTPNESQVRLFIQDDSTLTINEPFKAYYYIKGLNLKVVDNYTPYTTQTCVKKWTTSFRSSTEDNGQIETIPLSGFASTSYTLLVKRGSVVLKKILSYKL